MIDQQRALPGRPKKSYIFLSASSFRNSLVRFESILGSLSRLMGRMFLRGGARRWFEAGEVVESQLAMSEDVLSVSQSMFCP